MSPNLAPLIDVIFILLVFFMITSEFQKPALSLELPVAEENPVPKEDGSLVLSLDSSRRIALDGQIFPVDKLYQILVQKKSEQPTLSLILAIDKDLTFDSVLEVLAEIEKAEVSHVYFQHETPNF
ncbi:biopolymer transporter ExbD [Candidatus Haliotispira prima]|uniref:Biopolymer transporter ExbD n=1 Tax=Candidatus Haliotispira prima TaxID=3034016 RepID=A0ABY8MF31_9SPIO|nr:biopolymer transporter ExbD [Candidatus Haliotispira prima]